MSGPSWTLPVPPSGYQGIPSSEADAQDDRFYGTDIHLDVSSPDVVLGQAHYVTTAAGDWATATGREALRQSLVRRFITNPGEWQTKPAYGAGLRQYVKAKNTASVRAEIESRIRQQCALDQRVHSVDLVTVSGLDDGSPGLQIAVLVTPRGRLRTDKPLAVRLEIR